MHHFYCVDYKAAPADNGSRIVGIMCCAAFTRRLNTLEKRILVQHTMKLTRQSAESSVELFLSLFCLKLKLVVYSKDPTRRWDHSKGLPETRVMPVDSSMYTHQINSGGLRVASSSAK